MPLLPLTSSPSSLVTKLRPKLADILNKAAVPQNQAGSPSPVPAPDQAVPRPEKPVALGKPVSQVIPEDLPKLNEAYNEAVNIYQIRLQDLESKKISELASQ